MIRPMLPSVLFMLCALACGPERGTPVILISLDTLRQDHLKCYGYGRDTSPHLDRFAAEDAILFESAYAQVPYTLPSHMSILTGLYPEAHGVLYPFEETGETKRTRLSGAFVTLSEALKTGGYVTTAFTDGLFMERRYGFDQGFDEYRDERDPDFEKNGFRKFKKELYPWIRNHAGQDFFLFIHTYDTHSPYVPPEPFKSRFKDAPPGRDLPETSMQTSALLGAHDIQELHRYADLQDLIDLYDGCVAFADEEVGRLFRHLKELELWDDALIIVTSDHGQCFLENGFFIGHGLCATNEETLIPLLVKLPHSRFAGRRVNQVVESVDIMPTILTALEIPRPAECQGQDLLAGLESGRWSKDYAFGISPNTGNNHYLVRGGRKFIEAVNDPKGLRMKLILKPRNPPMWKRPEEPYLVNRGRKLYYDFDNDPLGVIELFHRGDRLYDMTDVRHEWKSTEIDDPAAIATYKETAYRLAARSMELGRPKWDEKVSAAPLTEEELEQLAALGYGGIVDSGKAGAMRSSKPGDATLELILKPPPADRSRLYHGDTLVWEIWRNPTGARKRMKPEEIASRLEEARACYEEFKAIHPERAGWANWRLKFLDRLSGRKGKNRKEDREDLDDH